MTVEQMLKSMSSKELTEWMGFASIEPIGGARGDTQAALIASITARHSINPPRKNVNILNYLPRYGVSEEQLTEEKRAEAAETLKAYFKAHAAKAAKKNDKGKN